MNEAEFTTRANAASKFGLTPCDEFTGRCSGVEAGYYTEDPCAWVPSPRPFQTSDCVPVVFPADG